MILVTGATGNNGVELLKQLSLIGAPVRAMVRKPRDSVAGQFTGAEFVTADFDDPSSLSRALNGIDRAFLVTNSSERVEEQQLRFVDLARAAGVQRIVYLSQLHAVRNSGFGVPGWQADGLIEDYAHYRRGEASTVSSSVKDVTGGPPRPFGAFARDYRQAFLASAKD